jgi:hypothetical protein
MVAALTPRPLHTPGLVTSEVLDELVAYAPATSQAVSLNVSARAIFELCNGTRTVDDICDELSGSVGMPPDALRADVQAAIDQMRDLGLLVASHP